MRLGVYSKKYNGVRTLKRQFIHNNRRLYASTPNRLLQGCNKSFNIVLTRKLRKQKIMIKIAIAACKGGVSKTTNSLQLADIFRKKGYRTLLVDLDCQGSASAAAGIDIEDDNLKTIKDIIEGADPCDVIIKDTPFGDLIANNLLMFDADRKYSVIGYQRKVRKALDKLKKNYDYVIIDCPPAFSFATTSALIAADYVIVPQLASMFSLLSLKQMKSMLDLIREEENEELKVLGIVLTKWNPRTKFSKDFSDVLADVAKELDMPVFESKIRSAISVEESMTEHVGICEYADGSKIANDFLAFADEVLERVKAEGKKNG